MPNRRKLSSAAWRTYSGLAPWRVSSNFMPNLRGDDGFAPPAGERAPKILLAVAFIVDVGGIEEIDAGVERGLHDAAGLGGIDAPSEIIAAQTGQRNLQRADFAAFQLLLA